MLAAKAFFSQVVGETLTKGKVDNSGEVAETMLQMNSNVAPCLLDVFIGNYVLTSCQGNIRS